MVSTSGNSNSSPPLPTLPTLSLQGRVVVATGGVQGLGFVMSRALVFSGADIAVIDSHKELADREAEKIVIDFKKAYTNAATLPKVTAHYTDVSSEEWVGTAIAGILSTHNNRIDHLVTSAGLHRNHPGTHLPPLQDAQNSGL